MRSITIRSTGFTQKIESHWPEDRSPNSERRVKMEVVENSLRSSASSLIQIIIALRAWSWHPYARVSVGFRKSVSRSDLLGGGRGEDRVLNVNVVGIVVNCGPAGGVSG